MLQEFKEFGERKAALLEDVRERALRNLGVHGNHGLPSLAANSFLKRNVTALLTGLHKASPFQGLDHTFAGDARQFGHVSGKLRRWSRTRELRRAFHRERPKFPDRVRWPRANWRVQIPRFSLAKLH